MQNKLSLHAIILAAGNGSRMKSSQYKVMHKVAGRELIMHIIHVLREKSIDKISTVIAPHMDDLNKLLLKNNVRIVNQIIPRGTGDAVKQAIDQNEDKQYILVLTGDTPLISRETILNLYNNAVNNQNDITVLGFKASNPSGYGRLIIENNSLKNIVEEKDANDSQRKINICNSGIILFKSNRISMLLDEIKNENFNKEYYLTDTILIAGNKGLKIGYEISNNEEELIGINTKHDLAKAENIYQNKLRYKFLEYGVTLIKPDSVVFSCDTVIGRDVIIHPFVNIGLGVIIEDNVEIKSFSHLEGVIVNDSAVIGPYARIRKGTVVGKKAKIGNFVELKNTKISNNVSIGHLSYIGDSNIGQNTNIGAGTITCNYDGYVKYRTNIGKDCLIGSNSSLIAPINIGDNVITGAGGIYNKDIDNNNIAYGKKEDIVKDNGAINYHNKKSK